MSLVRINFLFLSLLISSNLYAQDSRLEQKAEQLAEAGSSFEWNEQDIQNVFKTIDLNAANSNELVKSGLMDSTQAEAIIRRRFTGPILHINELNSMSEFNKEDINRIKPYVASIDGSISSGLTSHEYVIRYKQNRELSKAYDANTLNGYKGSPYKLYSRYSLSNYQLKAGLIAEKDPGEELFKGSQANGFDFYSGYLFINGKNQLKTIALGDYSLHFGQGLSMSTNFGAGKNTDLLSIPRFTGGINPYRSVNEYGFLRGVAMLWEFKKASITTFYSYTKVDAKLKGSEGFAPIATSFSQTGLHRTNLELNSKKNADRKLTGIHISQKIQSLEIGLTTYHLQSSHSIKPAESIYESYKYPHKEQVNAAIDYSFTKYNFHFFGETAFQLNGYPATLNGCLASLSPKLDFLLVYRNYHPKYSAFYANALAENSSNLNEKGIFSGINYQFSKRLKYSSFVDVFAFPYPSGSADIGLKGYEFVMRMDFDLHNDVKLYIQYRKKQKEQNDYSVQLHQLIKVQRNSWRFNIEYPLNERVSLKNRYELTNYQLGNDSYFGWLLFQDASIELIPAKLQIDLRYALFDINHSGASIYMFEKDVLYSGTVSALNSSGNRFYILLNYRFNKLLECWLRYSAFTYPGEENIRSGLDEINGDTLSDVTFQLKFNF